MQILDEVDSYLKMLSAFGHVYDTIRVGSENKGLHYLVLLDGYFHQIVPVTVNFWWESFGSILL